VSDEELRALERAARSRPGDVAAGWAYARALANAGRARERMFELARLARLGEDAAQAELERRASTIEPMRTAGRVRTFELPYVRSGVGVGVTERSLVFIIDDEIVAIDPKTFERKWAVSRHDSIERTVWMRGEDVLRDIDDELVLHDGENGEVIGRARLPRPPRCLIALGDRAAAVVRSEEGGESVLGIEVGERFGSILWRRDVATTATPLAFTFAGEIVVEHGHALETWGADDGALRAALFLPLADERFVARGDGRGVALTTSARDHPDQIEYQDLPAPQHRWVLGNEAIDDHALAQDAVVFVESRSAARLVALDRTNGSVRWRVPIPWADVGDRLMITAARDSVYVLVTAMERDGASVGVVGFDLANGDQTLEIEPDLHLGTRDIFSIEVNTLDRAVLSVVNVRTKLIIVRFEENP
jgi:hypothetical protein